MIFSLLDKEMVTRSLMANWDTSAQLTLVMAPSFNNMVIMPSFTSMTLPVSLPAVAWVWVERESAWETVGMTRAQTKIKNEIAKPKRRKIFLPSSMVLMPLTF
jgi:hypothetical protein